MDLRTRIAFSSLSLEELIDGCRDNAFAQMLQARPATADLMESLKAAAESFFRFGRDRETAKDFIGEFGRADIQNQVLSLSAYIDLLGQRHDALKAAYREKFRVNMMLYSFIGTAVALVLI